MKTKNDIKEINFNDYAFFKGVSTTDAKWKFANKLFDTKNIEAHLTKSGIPKIGINDKLAVSEFDFSMRSNSQSMDGKCQFEYLCDYYNKGIPLNTLRNFSEKEAFINAMKFTGKYSIVNDILNPEQLLKIQKTWLIISFEGGISDNTIKFEIANKWALQYMYESGIDIDRYERAKERFLNPEGKKEMGYAFQN